MRLTHHNPHAGRQALSTKRMFTILALATAAMTLPQTAFSAGPPPIDLRSAASFTVLAGGGITTTGGGVIGGDIGASPITGAAIHLTQAQVSGTIYAVDPAGPPGSVIDPALLTEAMGDLTTAYNFAAGLTPIPSGDFRNPGASNNIGGLTLGPGLYKFDTTAFITGSDLTLEGGPNDVWVFQLAADLQVGSGIKVILAGGAQARNIFWQVGTEAVLETFSVFQGTIMADQSVIMRTSSSMNGRALARIAEVTYNGTSGSLPADPYADYGDAPDDATFRFPTEDLTSNSRANSRGVHHFNVGKAYFGTTVTSEAGPHDTADPDGLPNLVDNDSDDGLLGIDFVPIGDSGMPFSGTTAQTYMMQATVAVTVAAGATIEPRYINILMDTNRDLEWKNSREGQEWVVSNYPVNIAPGTSQTMTLALGTITLNSPPRDADMWMRMTLTRQEIAKADFAGLGGWDGSGAFITGETEDYLLFAAATPNDCLIPPPPPAQDCPAEFKVRFNSPTVMLKEGESGFVEMIVTVAGTDSYATVDGYTAGTATAPLVGNGIDNFSLPGEIGTISPALNTQLGPGTHIIQIPVGPFGVTSNGITQSFAISFTVSGYNCNGERIYGSTSTAGVVVIHPLPGVTVRTAILQFGPGSLHVPGQPIALQPVSGDPIGYIRFGAQQLTSGTIYAMQVGDYPPGLPVDKQAGTVRMTSFFDIASEVSPTSATWEMQTQITGLDLAGHSPADLAAAGINDEAAELELRAGRYPTMAGSLFDVFTELSSNVGGSTSVDTTLHRVNIQDPLGFSYYSLGGPSSAAVPVTLSRISME